VRIPNSKGSAAITIGFYHLMLDGTTTETLEEEVWNLLSNSI